MDLKGIIDRFEESDRHQANEERIKVGMQQRHVEAFGDELRLDENTEEAGQECIDMVAGIEQRYESFWRRLGGYDREKNTCSREIVLEKEKNIGGKLGTLSASISPGSYTPAGEKTGGGWTVTFDFQDDNDEDRWYSEYEKGPWVNELCERAQYDGGQGYYPFYSWSNYWSREKVEKAHAYLEEKLPRFEATFQWMLEAACDPELNPEVADRAQAYREELLAAA